ncbi:MAG: carboxypeptidase regulatory-like domain-containing protein [Chitinophagia bacterium]|nr:carboxypeptidase regulatory-like domain-containing protein [Chitinophagia bacterium]
MKKTIGVVLVLLLACNKNSNQHSITVPDVIQAEKRRGNIVGTVQLIDLDGKMLQDASGATVAIDNSTMNSESMANGRWTLDSIPFGTYDLSISKSGYGTARIMGLFHAASNHAPTLIGKSKILNQISNIEVTALNTRKLTEVNPNLSQFINEGLAEDGIVFDPVFTSNTPGEKKVRLFFGTSPDVSTTNYVVTEKQKYSGRANESENFNFGYSWFESKGFQPGQTVYVKAFGDGYGDDDYDDPISGLAVFPSLASKGSPVASFVLPLK